ncbi:hypothetical protein ElyMa_006572600 [Elysia marginata]|uniref:Uncharacterized protein n=1 Tax=Elysia marginata TaxID=1093978 RepID=A0AAV4IDL1_9GAST|nr:hypothetical protein ElyMa_006572600 [Elysia marginata]
MHTEIKGASAFAHLAVVLAPGERVIAESGAMSSMDAGLALKAREKGLSVVFLGREKFGYRPGKQAPWLPGQNRSGG